MYRVKRKGDGFWHVEQYRWGSWLPVWVHDTTDHFGTKVSLVFADEAEARQALDELCAVQKKCARTRA